MKTTSYVLAVLVLMLGFASPVAALDHHEKAVFKVTTDSEDAQAHFWKGLNDTENVYFTRAAMHFEKAVAADPDFAMAHFMHALIVPGMARAERVTKMNEAMGHLTSASTEEMLLATALRERFNGNGAAAHTLFGAAAELMPDDAHVAFLHAQTAGTNGPAAVSAAMEDVTARFPDLAATYNLLAYNRWGNGDEAGAREAVAKYLELAPDHPNAHDSFAEIFQFSGMYNEAAKHYQHAIDMDPSYGAAYAGLAEVHTLMGKGDMARDYLNQGMAHAPTNGNRAFLKRAIANTYFMDGDLDNGIKGLMAAAQWAEENEAGNAAATANYQLAVAEALAGNTDQVKMYLDKALGDGEAGIGHYFWSGLAYGMAGNAAATREAADALAKTEANADLVHLFDGMAHLVAKDHAAAEKALIASGLDSVLERALMARCQAAMGHTAEANQFKQSVLTDSGFTAGNLPFAFARLSLAD